MNIADLEHQCSEHAGRYLDLMEEVLNRLHAVTDADRAELNYRWWAMLEEERGLIMRLAAVHFPRAPRP